MSNMSFASTLRPIFVAMAEPQLPEPTRATFSLPAEPLLVFAPLNATFLPGVDAPALPGDIALLLGSADASCLFSGMLGWELPQPMILASDSERTLGRLRPSKLDRARCIPAFLHVNDAPCPPWVGGD